MTADPSEHKPSPLASLRFSMRRLMQFVTLFAVLCGMAAVLPIYISHIILGAIWIAVVGWLATGVIFAKGDQRAFCIGAGIVVASTWTGVGARFVEGVTSLIVVLLGGMSLSGHVALWLDFLLLFAAAVANGWLCVQARNYFERRSGE